MFFFFGKKNFFYFIKIFFLRVDQIPFLHLFLQISHFTLFPPKLVIYREFLRLGMWLQSIQDLEISYHGLPHFEAQTIT